MNWSPQQDQALCKVDTWLHDPRKQVFYLAGYAGTGKTTLAKHFAANVPGETFFAAYTGKAAHVLHNKGCEGAKTIHQLIYLPKEKCRVTLEQIEQDLLRLRLELERNPTELLRREIHKLEDRQYEEKRKLSQPAFTLNEDSPLKGAALAVIDECSMVGARMGYDLLSFGTKLLVLGDPAQLPPVKDGGFFVNEKPDFILQEIHRQARDNPIINLATRVREGQGLPAFGSYGESKYVRKSELDPTEVLEADQVLVGRNSTRKSANTRLRKLRGVGESWRPTHGDKVVCLRNDHKEGLLNGSLWRVTNQEEFNEDTLILEIDNEDKEQHSVLAHANYFRDGKMEPMPWYLRKEAQEFDYGYALTVHKAQGSQWDWVVLLDESKVFNGHGRKWLYTAITRAARRITIVEF